jgi:predicted  nucleic acid-binding Zn-ribbon protein
MAAMGLHRWGATWVDEASFAQLQAQQKQIDDAVAKISSQIDQLKQDQNGCDTQISSVQQDIQNIQNSSVATDSKGHQIVINTTWQTQPLYQQITKLQKQKSDDQAKIDGFMHDIQQERAKIKTPSYTATQKLIGIERTPGLTPMKIAPTFSSPPIVAPIPAPPATQPTGPALPAGIGNPVTPGPTTR